MDVRQKVHSLMQLKRLRGEVDMLSQRIAELEPAARDGARRRDPSGDCAAGLARLCRRLDARRTRCMELLGAL